MKSDNEKFKKEFQERLYRFVLQGLIFTDKLPSDSTTKILRDQLVRSSTSILANYIEAQSASSRKDFINYFHHSLKSANESKIWLSLLKDVKRAPQEPIDDFLKELGQISNIFATSILTLKNRKKF